MHKVGLALGGGGVRGLAHISVLEALDELGCRPSVIAGTSMGAIIGALYASGMSGKDMKELIKHYLVTKDDPRREAISKTARFLTWFSAFPGKQSRGGMLRADRFFDHLFQEIDKTTFEDLKIPLIVVATDYWTAEEVAFHKGELIPALKASTAVPGVFPPVVIGGRVLIDGGVVNLVPYEHVTRLCDVTIAVDVTGTHTQSKHEVPGVMESILGTFSIMQTSALAGKLKVTQPNIYIRPDIRNVRLLDIGKATDVFEQAAPAVEELKAQLSQIKFA
jgi:NTE family protein